MKPYLVAVVLFTTLIWGCKSGSGTKNDENEAQEIAITLKASNGKYVCADDGRGGVLVADRDSASAWEKFTLVRLDSNKVGICSFKNLFVCADDGFKDQLVANREVCSGWETFTLVDLGNNKIALKSYKNLYVSARYDTLGLLFANQPEQKEWETFTIIYNPK